MKKFVKRKYYVKVASLSKKHAVLMKQLEKQFLMRVKEGSEIIVTSQNQILVDLYIDEEWKARIRAEIPELPDARQKRYVEELGLPDYDAQC